MSKSHLEMIMAEQIREAGLPAPITEYRFYPKRKWRADFAWPALMLLVEIEGGVWIRGRHSRPQGYTQDTEKYNTAVLHGWSVLRFTDTAIHNMSAISLITQYIERKQDDRDRRS